MPTGYTAALKDGISFQEFALGCARAFGALVTMRDDPADAPIPDRFEPSDYHAKAIKVAEERLRELDGMSLEAAGSAAQQDYDAAMARHRERIAENDALRVKYEAMLKQVNAWRAPTPDHEGLKKFMREQIESSIEYDCSNEYYFRNAPTRMTAMEWRSAQVEQARRDIGYHSKEHAEEVGRAAGRTDWVKALRESLPRWRRLTTEPECYSWTAPATTARASQWRPSMSEARTEKQRSKSRAEPLKPLVIGPCKETQGEDVAATVGRDDRQVMDALVNRFLGWPLPASVCCDLCVTDRDYQHPRSGTNLLTADEARAMLTYVLGSSP